MKADKILVPTDFSDLSEPVLKYATAFARDTGAKLLIAHVQEPLSAYGGGAEMPYTLPGVDGAALRHRLETVAPTDPSVAFEHRFAVGDLASEIVRLAEDEGVDLIVIGTHGRTGLMRLVMGSVAEAVVRHARCPVLTVKQPIPAAVESG